MFTLSRGRSSWVLVRLCRVHTHTHRHKQTHTYSQTQANIDSEVYRNEQPQVREHQLLQSSFFRGRTHRCPISTPCTPCSNSWGSCGLFIAPSRQSGSVRRAARQAVCQCVRQFANKLPLRSPPSSAMLAALSVGKQARNTLPTQQPLWPLPRLTKRCRTAPFFDRHGRCLLLLQRLRSTTTTPDYGVHISFQFLPFLFPFFSN